MLRRIAADHRLHVPLVLAVCALVYWPLLGHNGFAATEGHRVIPGWSMLESGDWLHQQLFGASYLRKPPGMSWAVAAFGAVLGETELAARAVSAASVTIMSVLATVFARRWFGRRWGLAAGLSQALMPVLWTTCRAAEIEALHLLATQCTVFCLIEAIRSGRGAGGEGGPRPLGWAMLAGLAGAAMVIVKGPAGMPCVAGVLIAACIGRRGARFGLNAWIGVSVALAAAVSYVAIAAVWERSSNDSAVLEAMGKFLWKRNDLWDIALLLPSAFIASLPAAAALPTAWLRLPRDTDPRGPGAMAKWLARSWLIALGVYTLVGVGNLRYTMPAVVFLPPLAAYIMRGAFGGGAGLKADEARRARISLLGHPLAMPAVFLVVAAVAVPGLEYARSRIEGRGPGTALGAAVPDGVEVWSDSLVESRPDVILYALREAQRDGRTFTPRWMKREMLEGTLPRPGHCLLLRTDNLDHEPRIYAAHLASGRLEPLATGKVYKYAFTLYRVK